MLRIHFVTALRGGGGRFHRPGASFFRWARGLFFAHCALLGQQNAPTTILLEKRDACLRHWGIQRLTVVGFFLRSGQPHEDVVGSVRSSRPPKPPTSWSIPLTVANTAIQLLLRVLLSLSHARRTRFFSCPMTFRSRTSTADAWSPWLVLFAFAFAWHLHDASASTQGRVGHYH